MGRVSENCKRNKKIYFLLDIKEKKWKIWKNSRNL